MKKLLPLLIFILLGFVTRIYGQNSARFHHLLTQQIINDASFTLLLKQSNQPDKTMQLPPGKVIKCVITLDKGTPALDIWRIEDDPTDNTKDEFGTLKNAQSNIVNAETPVGSLVLSDDRTKLGQPTRVLKVPFKGFTWGVATTPFRYRFRTDSTRATVASNLTLSLSYGYFWGKTTFTSRLTRHHANIVSFFFGAASADINSKTVKTPETWTKAGTADRTNPALSYGLSYTRSINNLGIVLSVGLDTAIGPYSSHWSFQNRPWIGIGVNTGIGLFK